jgi:hypothetical protein
VGRIDESYVEASLQSRLKMADIVADDVISVSESELFALGQSKDMPWKQLADGGRAAVVGSHHQMNCLVSRVVNSLGSLPLTLSLEPAASLFSLKD